MLLLLNTDSGWNGYRETDSLSGGYSAGDLQSEIRKV